MSPGFGAGRLLAERARLGPAPEASPLTWRLRQLAVCASTETELDRWLGRLPVGDGDPPLPLAVIADRQRFGRGQRGRLWSSPVGGVWLSPALPWSADPNRAAALGLAAAVGLARELQALLDGRAEARVALKWPNDLLLLRPERPVRKLAGLLPRLRRRGARLRWARLGVGLNGCNPVPPGGIALADLPGLGPGGARLRPPRLAARVLRGLEWAAAQADQAEVVRQAAEALLWPGPPLEIEGQLWQPVGLAADGRLRLARGSQEQFLERRF
ncbi:MAG: biotin--[acetyl-CoA-carboxylase] ligase [Synechococcaceae cyanobacterium]